MDVWEVLLVAIGLSIDVFVVSAYMGAGFSKIKKKICAACVCCLAGCSFLPWQWVILSLWFRRFGTAGWKDMPTGGKCFQC
ncbi:MAG: hypothetical protein V8S08_04630 [Lachnoclostridium sp.]